MFHYYFINNNNNNDVLFFMHYYSIILHVFLKIITMLNNKYIIINYFINNINRLLLTIKQI